LLIVTDHNIDRNLVVSEGKHGGREAQSGSGGREHGFSFLKQRLTEVEHEDLSILGWLD
jgi:hypothetical protein